MDGGRALAEAVRRHPQAQAIANAAFAYGSNMAPGSGLSVDVSHDGVDLGQTHMLAALLEMSTVVTELNASFNSLGPDSTLMLCRSVASSSSGIVTLDLAGNDAGSAWCVSAGCWPETLKKLGLSFNGIVDVSLLALPPGLENLDLSHNEIVDIAQLSLPDRMREVSLSGNPIANMARLTLPSGCSLRDPDE
jgi:hypothetical protein